MSSDVLYSMNSGGRVAVCGSISSYNSTEQPKGNAFDLMLSNSVQQMLPN